MDITIFKPEFAKALEFFKNDLSGLRTGRASTAIVEDVLVEAYGVRQQIKALATISVPDAKTVSLEPWDKSVLANIEKAIRESNLGVSPVNNGRTIILSLPELTTERRQELVKVLRQKSENARIAIRKVREEAKALIEEAESNKEIGEDEKFRLIEELEKIVKESNDKVKEIGEKKEAEINAV
jgi:ribosome recycling factor